LQKRIKQKRMQSFLQNDAVSDTTEVELCTGADNIKQKYV
jgi:hypothetical protein